MPADDRAPPPHGAQPRHEGTEHEHRRRREGHGLRITRVRGEQCLRLRDLTGDRLATLIGEPGEEPAHSVWRLLVEISGNDHPGTLNAVLHRVCAHSHHTRRSDYSILHYGTT